MVYSTVKHVLRSYFPIFFDRIYFEGKDHVPDNKPVIFAVNHQNTFLDATLVAYTFKRNTYFLVRSDVFKGGIIKRLFKSLYLLPISRGKDNMSDMLTFNKNTFEVPGTLRVLITYNVPG